jgi:hypothetical protein
MSDQESRVLQFPNEPQQLVAAALTLARSNQASDHQTLQHWLLSSAFLDRLDSPQEYADTGRRLRIQRVLQALGENPTVSARNVLVALTQNRGFLQQAARVDHLLRATASIRPAPPPVVQFWNTYSQPDDGFSNVTLQAVLANGSSPAIALLEKKLSEPGHPEDDKQHWIRCYILEHRNDPELLTGCQRMLAGTLPEHLRPVLIDALFDYRPREWFAPAEVCHPPDRTKASSEAKALLHRLGQTALANATLTPVQRQAVERTLREIGQP